MLETFSIRRFAAVCLAALAISTVASDAFAKKVTVGPVTIDVPDDFKDVPGKVPTIHQESSGIAVEASPLPPEALHEFQGQTFLDFLASLGYTNAAYANAGLKRTDKHTYVLADAKGARGPEARFLLVIGGKDQAAIVTAYAPKGEIANGHASRAAIEAILDTASVVPATP
jgi:hypothetical protein